MFGFVIILSRTLHLNYMSPSLLSVNRDGYIFSFPFGSADQIKILLDQQDKLYARQSELKALLEDCEASSSQENDGASTALENWSGSFEWDSKADDLRLNIFGISSYRANQREVKLVDLFLYSKIGI